MLPSDSVELVSPLWHSATPYATRVCTQHQAGRAAVFAVARAVLILQPDMDDTAITLQQAFSLHSRPNTERKLFLDFDGRLVQVEAAPLTSCTRRRRGSCVAV